MIWTAKDLTQLIVTTLVLSIKVKFWWVNYTWIQPKGICEFRSGNGALIPLKQMQYLITLSISTFLNPINCKKNCHRPISSPTGPSIKDVGKCWSFLAIFDPSPLILTYIDFWMTPSPKNVVNLQFLHFPPPSKLPTSFMDGSYWKYHQV